MVPSGYVKIAIENFPVEIVDLPSYKMVDLSIVMLVYPLTPRASFHRSREPRVFVVFGPAWPRWCPVKTGQLRQGHLEIMVNQT